MKQKSGIGFMKLIISIIVITIVVIIGVSYARKEIDKENVKNMQADMLLVQAKIELVKGNYSMDKENNPLKGYQLTQLPDDINIQDFYDKNIITQDEYEKYYLLDLEALEQCGLGELAGDYDGYFIVNYDDYEVIYTKGYQNTNGLWCYKISELNKVNEPGNQQEIAVVAEPEDSETVENENSEKNENTGNTETAENSNTENTKDQNREENSSQNGEEDNNSEENNQNNNIDSLYYEINNKIKEGIIKAKEKAQEVSILVQ